LLRPGKKLVVFRKSQVAGLARSAGAKPFELRLGISKHFTLKMFSNDGGGESHRSVGKSHVDLKNFRHYKDAQQQFNLYFIWPKLCASG
jgi:hypothetical protein